MQSTTHPDFEIAIERELHGALDAAEAMQLAEHLVGCASCRAYQKTALETETDMEAIGNLFSQGVVWGRLKATLDERLASERTKFWWLVLANFAAAVAWAIYFVRVRHHVPLAALGCGVALGVVLLLTWRLMRRFEQRAKDAERSTDDLFAVLDEKNRKERRAAWCGLVVVACNSYNVPDIFAKSQVFGWVTLSMLVVLLLVCVQRLVRLRQAAFQR